MSSFVGYNAPRQARITSRLAQLGRKATEPGVVVLVALAILSFAIGLANPEQAAELALLF